MRRYEPHSLHAGITADLYAQCQLAMLAERVPSCYLVVWQHGHTAIISLKHDAAWCHLALGVLKCLHAVRALPPHPAPRPVVYAGLPRYQELLVATVQGCRAVCMCPLACMRVPSVHAEGAHPELRLAIHVSLYTTHVLVRLLAGESLNGTHAWVSVSSVR